MSRGPAGAPLRDGVEVRPDATLSVVMPVYNGVDWVERTVTELTAAMRGTRWEDSEIVVVDDGSDDGSSELLDELATRVRNLKVVHTDNQGRFLARRNGLLASTGDLVLLIDVRVFLHRDSLRFVETDRVETGARVYNAHVEIDTSRNPYARFWQAVTFVAWRRYLADPRRVSFTDEDFDYYPKGTTAFLVERELLVDAYDSFSTLYEDMRRVNDDTALIRHMAARAAIHIDPRFACTYHARGNLKSFLAHAYHRGMPFVDGYLHPGTRYFVPLLGLLAATPVGIVVAASAPAATAAAGAVGLVAVGGGLLVLRVPPRTALWFTLLLPPFAVVYAAGIWSGVAMAARAKLRRRR